MAAMKEHSKQFSLRDLLKIVFIVAGLLLLPINNAHLSRPEFILRLIVLGIAAWLIPDLFIQWRTKSKRL
jgi:hypothetical protein